MTADTPTPQSIENHSLLIEIKTKLERVITDVAKLNDTLVSDIAKLQIEKQDKYEAQRIQSELEKVQGDHESRIRSNEQWKWKTIGIIVAINAIIGIAIALASAYIARGPVA